MPKNADQRPRSIMGSSASEKICQLGRTSDKTTTEFLDILCRFCVGAERREAWVIPFSGYKSLSLCRL